MRFSLQFIFAERILNFIPFRKLTPGLNFPDTDHQTHEVSLDDGLQGGTKGGLYREGVRGAKPTGKF